MGTSTRGSKALEKNEKEKDKQTYKGVKGFNNIKILIYQITELRNLPLLRRTRDGT